MAKSKDTLPNDFDIVQIMLASPERVLEWSHGEVTKPETINYRTQRAEKNGLFDERIFGPERDYECYCGKYKGVRFKGIVCEKCGVEVTRSVVRRERMGHIELAAPVSHIWFLKGIPSRIALLLGISVAEVEKVIYFAGYIVTEVYEDAKQQLLKDLESEFKEKLAQAQDDKTKQKLKELAEEAKREIESIHVLKVLDENQYHKFSIKYGSMFKARVGAEAIYDIFKEIDLFELSKELWDAYQKAQGSEKDKLQRRIALVDQMIEAGIRPEWMFITHLPVIPPALRPMVALEGGRHASSDLNDLYRRVINRNNRLKKLIAIKAPDVILRNEKRILQEAVDALIDNSIRRSNAGYSIGARRRPLKSLADYLKGKQGYFRQNLLGKRVDYSGRSVIVVGPDLRFDQCGLPKHMALELFRPFVIAKLIQRELAYNIKGANRLIEEGIPEVWAILEEVIKDKYVLLNRAPTLHRQSIQAFKPVLIEGDAIQIHPLVCEAYNADFDGDMMAVHVPITQEAQLESREIMSSRKNILKPGSGEVITNARQDMILGAYWMTKIIEGAKGEGKVFGSTNEAITAYDYGAVDFRAKIKVMPGTSKKYAKFNGELFETSVGRLLFNAILPDEFEFVNEVVDRKKMAEIVNQLIELVGLEGLPDILDKIKDFGFKYATKAGITFSMSDLKVPEKKKEIIEQTKKAVEELWEQYKEGLLSEQERKTLTIELWQKAKDEIEKLVEQELDPNNPIADMLISGARGSLGQLTQMTGMKGLIQSPKGDIIETPVISSYKEGMTPIEYFITTHGSRKGLADTALKTAQAGYLTRRLFNVAQDVIVREPDCGTKEYITLHKISPLGIEQDLGKLARGRVLAQDVVSKDGQTIAKAGERVTTQLAKQISQADVEEISVYSPMTCKTPYGVCQKCYGDDITTREQIDLGEAVGVVAAQAIGEPGTQLTMNTKHAGGAAKAEGDVTQGLPRVEEIFDNRTPKYPAVLARVDGVVTDIVKTEQGTLVVILPEQGKKAGKKDREYLIPEFRRVIVEKGQSVKKGDFLTDGSAVLQELFELAGKRATQEYIISEVSKIYELQGVTIDRKHMEIIVKQMFSRVKITDKGDSRFVIGQIVEKEAYEQEAERVKLEGGKPPKAKELVTSITETVLTKSSWLAAASFQSTTRKLTEAAVSGAKDYMRGLVENVIAGRLIPAGTGFEGSHKHKMMQEFREKLLQQDNTQEA